MSRPRILLRWDGTGKLTSHSLPRLPAGTIAGMSTLSDIPPKSWLIRAFLAALVIGRFFIPSQPVRMAIWAILADVATGALIVHMRTK